MSRHWRYHAKDDSYFRRLHPKKYTAAWQLKREHRAATRRGCAQQSRNNEGFIVKTDPATGGTVLYDPGKIDRYLWMQNAAEDG